MSTNAEPVALTQFAHGAGCGCKIAPQVLKEILYSNQTQTNFENLLVGYGSNDDAAVYDLGNGEALISTVDFFMPIVDDAFDFGRVAAANAISDVYAMGGKPNMALAILGWPVNKLPTSLAQRVLEGARSICALAGIPMAGGHSIDTLEPMFGLSVNGLMKVENLKKNNTAQEGDFIFMTKPLGVGIFSTAQKRGLIKSEDSVRLTAQLIQLNSIGEKFGKIRGVTAMTDITGFGLLGHIIEMAEGSGLTAVIDYEQIPKMEGLSYYIEQKIVPDATYRNWNAYSKHVAFGDGVNVTEAFQVLPDPQTNGGLLLTVKEEYLAEVINLMKQNELLQFTKPIGRMMKKEVTTIRVEK